jgi:hypothetical protein
MPGGGHEPCEEFVSLLGGDDSAGAPVGRIRTWLDQARSFEVIQDVGHDRTVDSEVLGEGELTSERALSGRRKEPGSPLERREGRPRVMSGPDVGPKIVPGPTQGHLPTRRRSPRRPELRGGGQRCRPSTRHNGLG